MKRKIKEKRSMMKLGLVSAILPDNTFEEVIDYAAKTGFEYVEVCCWLVGKALRHNAGGVELPAAGKGVLNYERYLKLFAKHHPNMPLIIEHLDEGEIPVAKKFVDGVLQKVGV